MARKRRKLKRRKGRKASLSQGRRSTKRSSQGRKKKNARRVAAGKRGYRKASKAAKRRMRRGAAKGRATQQKRRRLKGRKSTKTSRKRRASSSSRKRRASSSSRKRRASSSRKRLPKKSNRWSRRKSAKGRFLSKRKARRRIRKGRRTYSPRGRRFNPSLKNYAKGFGAGLGGLIGSHLITGQARKWAPAMVPPAVVDYGIPALLVAGTHFGLKKRVSPEVRWGLIGGIAVDALAGDSVFNLLAKIPLVGGLFAKVQQLGAWYQGVAAYVPDSMGAYVLDDGLAAYVPESPLGAYMVDDGLAGLAAEAEPLTATEIAAEGIGTAYDRKLILAEGVTAQQLQNAGYGSILQASRAVKGAAVVALTDPSNQMVAQPSGRIKPASGQVVANNGGIFGNSVFDHSHLLPPGAQMVPSGNN